MPQLPRVTLSLVDDPLPPSPFVITANETLVQFSFVNAYGVAVGQFIIAQAPPHQRLPGSPTRTQTAYIHDLGMLERVLSKAAPLLLQD